MSVINNGLQEQAKQMALKAKDGTLTHNKTKYFLKFDQSTWTYNIKDEHCTFEINFNTKLLKQAKEWLKEYLDN